MEQFGFDSLELTGVDFLEPGMVIQLGHPPNRIELLTSLTGIEFEAYYNSRVVVQIDDNSANFPNLEDLRTDKQAAGRPQDLAVIKRLK